MSPTIRRLVLDVMTPHEPSIIEFAEAIAERSGVDGVNVVLVETDRAVHKFKLTMEGSDIDADAVESTVVDLGGTVHSYDQVVCGDRLVEQSRTPQDWLPR